MNQRLREEQDMAYQQALEQDREKVASAPEGWHFLGFLEWLWAATLQAQTRMRRPLNFGCMSAVLLEEIM
jgi:hypothetical protein